MVAICDRSPHSARKVNIRASAVDETGVHRSHPLGEPLMDPDRIRTRNKRKGSEATRIQYFKEVGFTHPDRIRDPQPHIRVIIGFRSGPSHVTP